MFPGTALTLPGNVQFVMCIPVEAAGPVGPDGPVKSPCGPVGPVKSPIGPVGPVFP
jgi:hypothetical protein